jgi:hypothetical protein
MLLIGFIGYAVTGQMERRADVVIQWQLVYFGSCFDLQEEPSRRRL